MTPSNRNYIKTYLMVKGFKLTDNQLEDYLSRLPDEIIEQNYNCYDTLTNIGNQLINIIRGDSGGVNFSNLKLSKSVKDSTVILVKEIARQQRIAIPINDLHRIASILEDTQTETSIEQVTHLLEKYLAVQREWLEDQKRRQVKRLYNVVAESQQRIREEVADYSATVFQGS